MKKLKPNQFRLGAILITERPLLYQTEMVKANLEYKKNQTRRTRGLENFQKWEGVIDKVEMRLHQITHELCAMAFDPIGNWILSKCPYGKPGDLLWVRETFAEEENWDSLGSNIEYLYRADYNDPLIRYSPSIHMPKTASRLWLMVEEIRVERVQDISEEDAIAEGIEKMEGICWKNYDRPKFHTSKPIVSFWSLWKSINGQASWEANPWVWVIKYRILSKSGRPSDDLILQNYLEVTSHKAVIGV